MIKVNLQPRISIEVREGFRMPLWPLILLLILGAVGTFADYWFMSNKKMELEAEIRMLDFKLQDFQTIITEYEKKLSDKEYLQGKRDFVNGISQNQRQWIDFFDQMKETIPKDVWFTRFEGNRTGSYSVDGNTFTFAAIGFLMLQFNSISYVNTVSLTGATSNAGGGKDVLDAVTKKFSLSGTMDLVPKKDKPPPANTGAAPGRPGQ